jgi:hypothetical protein
MLVAACNLLIHWKQDPKNLMHVLRSTSDGVAFANVRSEEHHTQECTTQENPQIQCYNCQEMGHYVSVCMNEWRGRRAEVSGTQALMAGVEGNDYDKNTISFNCFNMEQQDSNQDGHLQHQGAEVSKTWILLDNQSTADVFCNPKLLKDILKVNKVMKIKCNAGVTRTNLVGNLPGYSQVWFNKNGITNILSFSSVEEKCRVTYDSASSKQFIIHKGNGVVHRFKQSRSGLFYLDAKETSEDEVGTMLINTVDDNKNKYANAAYKQATPARKLQNIIG